MNLQQKLLLSIKRHQPDFYHFLVNNGMGALPGAAPAAASGLQSIIESIGNAATAFYGARQQNQLLKTNLKLVSQGKEPIDPSTVAPTVRVDVDTPMTRDMQKYMPFILLFGAGAVVWMIARPKRGR